MSKLPPKEIKIGNTFYIRIDDESPGAKSSQDIEYEGWPYRARIYPVTGPGATDDTERGWNENDDGWDGQDWDNAATSRPVESPLVTESFEEIVYSPCKCGNTTLLSKVEKRSSSRSTELKIFRVSVFCEVCRTEGVGSTRALALTALYANYKYAYCPVCKSELATSWSDGLMRVTCQSCAFTGKGVGLQPAIDDGEVKTLKVLLGKEDDGDWEDDDDSEFDTVQPYLSDQQNVGLAKAFRNVSGPQEALAAVYALEAPDRLNAESLDRLAQLYGVDLGPKETPVAVSTVPVLAMDVQRPEPEASTVLALHMDLEDDDG